ncbi:MAG: DUF5658 family protein [Desulfurococcales archaeon]|nr:DUF5658 family protein [Desulfurococcales archaeon]
MRPRPSLLLILVLQFLDGLTTIVAVRAGALELNPLVRHLIVSPWLLLAAKLLAGWLIWLTARENSKLILLILVIYAQAVITNSYNLLVASS